MTTRSIEGKYTALSAKAATKQPEKVAGQQAGKATKDAEKRSAEIGASVNVTAKAIEGNPEAFMLPEKPGE